MEQKNPEGSKDVSDVAAEEAKTTPPPYQRIYLVLNPAAGGDEPVINTINDVFHPIGIQWEVDVTHKYGDAQELACQATEAGYDLVAGYGGDGTQHEIANGLIGTGVTMGVLPGGTGNGFCREMGLPDKLKSALEILATSHKVKKNRCSGFRRPVFHPTPLRRYLTRRTDQPRDEGQVRHAGLCRHCERALENKKRYPLSHHHR
jgi:hypothetical protein